MVATATDALKDYDMDNDPDENASVSELKLRFWNFVYGVLDQLERIFKKCKNHDHLLNLQEVTFDEGKTSSYYIVARDGITTVWVQYCPVCGSIIE